jgi:hypothetical protein
VAFFAAFAFHVDHCGAVFERSHVSDIDQSEFFCPQSREKRGKNESEIPFFPVCSASIWVICDSGE